MSAPLSQQVAHIERELAGERVLRRGWEAECRRVLEENRELRARLARSDDGDGGPQQPPSPVVRNKRPSPSAARMVRVEDRLVSERRGR